MHIRTLTLAVPLLLLAGCADSTVTAPTLPERGAAMTAAAATLVVTSADDNHTAGTLRSIIDAAASGDVITFDPALGAGPLVVHSSPIIIDKSIVITGPVGGITIRGAGSNIFRIGNGTYQVVLENLTLREGSWGAEGGAIDNRGHLLIRNSTLEYNFAGYRGGAVFNTGTLRIENSTIANNGVDPVTLARTERGGGVANVGTVTIVNSTISGNSASLSAGGIWAVGPTTVLHSTVAGNGAQLGGGIEFWSSPFEP